MKTLLKISLFLGLLVSGFAQTIQTVHTNPSVGSTTNCGGSPNIQYNDQNGTMWGCKPASGWVQLSGNQGPETLSSLTNLAVLRAGLDGAYGTPATIVFWGDSITEGSGAPTFNTSWTPMLTQALQQAYGNGQPAGTGFCSSKNATANASGCLITLSGTWTSIYGFGPSQLVTGANIALVQRNGAGATATTIFPAGNDTIVLYCGEYTDSSAGFTVTIDGNAVASACAANANNYTMVAASYTGLSTSIPHTIVATAPNSGGGYLFGFQGYASTGGVTMMNVSASGATTAFLATNPQVAWLNTVPNLAAIFVALGQNETDLTGVTAVSNLAALKAEATVLNVPIIYVLTENDSVNKMNSIEVALKQWAYVNNYTTVSVADYWGLYASAPSSFYNLGALPHPSQAGHYDIANLILNQLRLTPPASANAAPLAEHTLSVVVPTSDLICAHAGDTSINSLTCTNAADAAGVYKAFATTWTLPLNFWQAGRVVEVCGMFEYWSTSTSPTILVELLLNGVTALYTPSGSMTPGNSKSANGWKGCWQLVSTSSAGTSVFTEPINLTVFPSNTNLSQSANGTGQPKSIGNNAYPITFAFQYSATGLLSGTYTSGVTATGTLGQTCTLATFNNGNSGGTATVALTGTNTIAGGTALVITNTGQASTSAATSATAGNGTATCTGTATVATVLGGAQGNGVWLQALTVTLIR